MTYGLTLELARQANAMARAYHPAFYASVHELVADLPSDGERTGGPYCKRAAKVWFSQHPTQIQLVYCESAGDDEALLTELQQHLNTWAAAGTPPEELHWISEERAAELLQLATHPLTAASDRTALLGKYLRWLTEKDARTISADLTTKIEARSPGVLTGRSWMPHGEPVPKPAPNPYATAA